jgi:hypothetical protein
VSHEVMDGAAQLRLRQVSLSILRSRSKSGSSSLVQIKRGSAVSSREAEDGGSLNLSELILKWRYR